MRSAKEVGFRFKLNAKYGENSFNMSAGVRSTDENNFGLTSSMSFESDYGFKLSNKGISTTAENKKSSVSLKLGFYWKHGGNNNSGFNLGALRNKTTSYTNFNLGPGSVQVSSDGTDEFSIGLDPASRRSKDVSVGTGVKNATTIEANTPLYQIGVDPKE